MSLEKIVAGVDGAVDIQTEQVTGLPLLEFIPDADALRRHGISRQQLQDQLATALGGEVAEHHV